MKRVWLILVALVGLMAGVAPASADIQYTLNCSNSPCTGSSANNSFGMVTLHQVGSGSTAFVRVTVTLTGTTGTNVFLTTGSHSGFTFNLQGSGNPSSITVTTPSSGFTVQGTTAGSYGNSPFGNFEYAIENTNTGGSNGIAGPLVFDVKKTGGLLLTDTLFSANSGGYFFAADIGRNCVLSSGKWDCGGRTGVVASNVRIPEPGTMSLSIVAVAGLMGLVMLQRRRKLARA